MKIAKWAKSLSPSRHCLSMLQWGHKGPSSTGDLLGLCQGDGQPPGPRSLPACQLPLLFQKLPPPRKEGQCAQGAKEKIPEGDDAIYQCRWISLYVNKL